MPDLPRTIGLCPDPEHTGEFYVPDAKWLDRCPEGHDGEGPVLIIYALTADGIAAGIHDAGVEKAERETVRRIAAWARENAIESRAADCDEAGHRWHLLADAIDREFGDEARGRRET
jgi:hypothetical protein